MNVSVETPEAREQEPNYQLSGQLLQPWSTPVLKTSLPPQILEPMIEITDQLIADQKAETHGDQLVGQIETELKIPVELLEKNGVREFLEFMVREYVIACKCQEHPFINDTVKSVNWDTQITSCWVVSQRPNEYNPVHFHHQHVSAVTYLKVPKMKPSRKPAGGKDGCIEFIGVGSRDRRLSSSQFHASPRVGDFYLFGAAQLHTVYPYRCDDMEDAERRSVSFNATFSQA